MKRPNVSPAALALAGALLLAACGGSDGDSSPAPGATRIATGAITAAGSGTMTVNGVQYSTDGAAVKVEDSPGGIEDLKPGMVVTVKGRVDDRTGTATEVEFEHAVEGGVTAVVDDNTLRVGGQTVRVDDTTHFEDNVNRLGGVSVGDRVRVSGVPDDKGGLRATRVEDSPHTEGIELKGIVSNLGAAGTTPVTFALKVSPAATETWNVTLSGAPPAGLANGSYVEVKSPNDPAGFAITGATAELEDRLGDGSRAFDEYEVEGIVASGSSTEFVVNGVTVKPLTGARWVYGVPGDLVPGVKVEAEGHGFDSSGALLADKISFRAVVEMVAHASGATDGMFGTVEMFGLPVSLSPNARWDDLTMVQDDDKIEVRGYPRFDASGNVVGVVAERVRLYSSGNDDIYLQGVVTAKTADALTMLGRTIATTGATSYHPHDDETTSLTKAQFMALVTPGVTVVKAKGNGVGSYSGTTLTADELELEND